MARPILWIFLVGGLLVGTGAVDARAQSSSGALPFCREPARRTATLNTRGLAAVYCDPSSGLARALAGAHASARPVFAGAVPLAWAVALLRGQGRADAYRLGLAQAGTYGLVVGLKRAVGRPRPFVTRALRSRSARYGPALSGRYRSFPSGHAAVSAALVTSWSLSVPQWYVVTPGAMWAVAVSASRLYLGVHYPSDVLVGVGLGVGVAVLLHQMRGILTPDALQGGHPLPVGIQVHF